MNVFSEISPFDKCKRANNMSDVQKLPVYVCAFSCEPGRGSEPGVGYSMAESLATLSLQGRHDITVFTRPHRIDAIQAALYRSVPNHQVTIIPIGLPLWFVAATKGSGIRLAYIVWQVRAVVKIAQLNFGKSERFVVHHVTFATEALPTFESLLGKRATIVFGPAGSSQALNVKSTSRVRAKVRYHTRRFIGRLNMRKVALAVANNDFAAQTYTELGALRTVVEPNIVVPSALVEEAMNASSLDTDDTYDFICVGQLRELKRYHLAIDAFARMEDRSKTMLIVGDGPLRQDLERQCESLGVGDRVAFAGSVNRRKTLALMAKASVLVHPSRQEGSAWVVGEAQAVGTVPVVISGSGCEATVRLGGLGVIAEDDPESLLLGMEQALSTSGQPSHRWIGSRMPRILEKWYDTASSIRP
jgi:glycosyltransferase involved in cell wall biosynthesis